MTVLGRSLAQSQVTVGTYEYLLESLAVQFHGEGEGDLVERVVGLGGYAQELSLFKYLSIGGKGRPHHSNPSNRTHVVGAPSEGRNGHSFAVVGGSFSMGVKWDWAKKGAGE